jgi:AraC family chitin signaling transcriptional activator
LSSLLFTSSFYTFAAQPNTLEHLVSVFDITQDAQGYIWIAGYQGLTRYDGSSLTTFNNANRNWKSPFNWVNEISHDADNFIVSTENNGLNIFTPKTGKTVHLESGFTNSSVYAASYFKGQYYFHTKPENNLYSFDPVTSKTTLIQSNINVTRFIENDDKLLFYNTSAVFNVSFDLNKKITPYIAIPTETAIIRNKKIVIASKNNLYLYDGIHKKNVLSLTSKIMALAPEFGTHNFFSIDNNGLIKKYDENLNELKHGYENTDNKYVRNIYHDNSNTLWLTNNQGVYRLTEKRIINHPRTFKTWSNNINVELYDNELVLGSYGAGLHNFNKESSSLPDINQFFSKKGLIITDLLTIEKDLYIATFNGVWRYQNKTGKLQQLNFLNNNKIILKLTKKDNQLFIATDENGFLIYNLKQQKITDTIDQSYNFSSTEIIDILPLKNNTLWLATAKGLDIYNVNSKSIESIDLPGSTKVISLEALNNKVYVATKGDGIFVFNQQKELLSRIAVGIDFVSIKLLKNELWASSRNGLYKVSPENNSLKMVANTENHSFSGEPVLFNNSLYIGHFGGVLQIPLTDEDRLHPKVYISKSTVSGQSYLQNKTINIRSDSDVVTLDLASLDYRSGQKKQYKYQINAANWQEVNGNQLTLTGLSSGEYHISIQGTNSLGQWSDHQAFANINVAYPWYWTPLMRVIYATSLLMLVSIIAWLLYLRGKSISQIHQLLSTDLKTRGMISLNVSRNLTHAVELYDDIDKYNQHNDEKKLSYSKEDNDYSLKEKQIKAILVDSIHELTKQSKKNQPDALYGKKLWVALPYFVDYIYKKYHVKVTLQIDISDGDISYELQADIYKIIYEAIISAVLNDTGRKFNVLIQIFKQKLWLTIDDDRNSFSHFTNKISFNMAMYYIRQISYKHNASINTFNEQAKGSQLVISIPLMKLT